MIFSSLLGSIALRLRCYVALSYVTEDFRQLSTLFLSIIVQSEFIMGLFLYYTPHPHHHHTQNNVQRCNLLNMLLNKLNIICEHLHSVWNMKRKLNGVFFVNIMMIIITVIIVMTIIIVKIVMIINIVKIVMVIIIVKIVMIIILKGTFVAS